MATLNSFKEPGIRTSNFDLSTTRTFSTTPGVITPFYHRTTFPGDKFFVKMESGIETLPLQSPLWSAFRSRIAWYWLSWRAVSPVLHYNAGSIDPRAIKLPRFYPSPKTLTPQEIENTGLKGVKLFSLDPKGNREYIDGYVHRSSLYNYLYYTEGTVLGDIAGSAGDEYIEVFQRNGIPFYMYYSVFYHYYANWQESSFPIISSWTTDAFPSATTPQYYSTVTLSSLQSDLLAVGLSRTQINLADPDRGLGLSFFGVNKATRTSAAKYPYGGLCMCTHRPDMLTALVSSASRDAVAAASVVDVSSGVFTVDSFIGAEKIKKYLELGFFGATGYRDWVYAQFGVTPPADCGVPSLLGYTDTYINFSTIVANSADGLGELGARGTGHNQTRLRRFNFTEFGTLMALHTLVPVVTYGALPLLEDHNVVLSDYGSPALSAIQWQPLLRHQRVGRLPLIHTSETVTSGTSVEQSEMDYIQLTSQGLIPLLTVEGYQPAWSDYMSDIPRSFGEVAPSAPLSHWLLNRSFYDVRTYERDSTAGNPIQYSQEVYRGSSYIFPTSYQVPFVDNSPGASNFFVQVNLDIRARRPFAKKALPTL